MAEWNYGLKNHVNWMSGYQHTFNNRVALHTQSLPSPDLNSYEYYEAAAVAQ